jgi:hypothetical protein
MGVWHLGAKSNVTPMLCSVDSLSEAGKRRGAVIDKINENLFLKRTGARQTNGGY